MMNGNQSMKGTILVTGVNGQVGFELRRSLQGLGRIVALDRAALDLADYGYVLENGSVVLEGPAAELRQDERVIAAYLGIKAVAS